MSKIIDIRVSPEVSGTPEELRFEVAKNLGVEVHEISHIQTIYRSIDARQKSIKINLRLEIYLGEEFKQKSIHSPHFQNVNAKTPIIIIGAGPAGLFAALQLLVDGKKPIIIERGKNVRDRIEDIRGINVHNTVNEDSNYCFGEGGAGTYSDGKLYTRSKKRGDIRQILEILVFFGASPDILIDAHPHIGTNLLPGIIKNIRECILSYGGEIHFQKRVIDILMDGKSVKGVITSSGEKFLSDKIILATGHSARDIFSLLFSKKIAIQQKNFAVGVRVEHPQSLIDSIQYSCETRSSFLPPSEYSIVKQIENRGVYSFCMCPGGVIAPCATEKGQIVTNGWSSSARSRSTANSGIVVELNEEDFKPFAKYQHLSGIYYQRSIEEKAFQLSNHTQKAPAQRLVDFLEGKVSTNIPKTSYPPGVVSIDMKELLPPIVYHSLKKGFQEFGKAMKGYLTNDAVIHAPETRTSSPVQIPRNPTTLEHTEIQGLYPCGEGAGYAGGIVSAAMDGMKVASRIMV